MLHDPNAQPAPYDGAGAACAGGPSAYPDGVSPSLLGDDGSAAAYELKFLISETLAAQVEQWIGAHLALDPHADAALGNIYRIHSLYLDTATLDVFHRSPSYKRRKFRLRRYGTECGLFLERKTKSGQCVRKRRTLIPDVELDRLHAAPDPDWTGFWFQSKLLARQLRPTCQITYDRLAYVGVSNDGPLRLTLDRRILCVPAQSWIIAEPEGSRILLPDQVVLELKYRAFVPTLFKRLMHEFNLNPQASSKYRLGIEAWGLHENLALPSES